MTEEHYEVCYNALREASAYVCIVLGTLVDNADLYMTELFAEMRRRGDLRQSNKQRVGLILKKKKALQYACMQDIRGAEEAMMTFMDTIEDENKEHFEKLYFSIKNAFDRRNVEDSAYKARFELVYYVLQIAVEVYDSIVEKTRRITGADIGSIRQFMQGADPMSLFEAWDNLLISYCKTPRQVRQEAIDDKNTLLGRQILVHKLIDIDNLDKISRKAFSNGIES